MPQKLQAVRGMNDVLPGAAARWRALEQTLAHVLERYGYAEMRIPIVEPTELYARTLGAGTDIVAKEMYTFAGRSGESLTLRPEGTAGVVRAALEHGLLQGRGLRVWYLGPMFRHERPQRGRYRQFHQIGAECFGYAEPGADVELIALTSELLRAAGLPDARLEINSLGDPAARARYRDALTAFLREHADALDEDDRRRLAHNPLRVLDSKNPALAPVLAQAPRLDAYLDDACTVHFAAVREGLAALGIACNVNPRLVRGLDYYSRTVFEWVSPDLGAQATVCAGGRYDGLVAQLGGRDTPAVGFALGLERLVALLEGRGALALPRRPLWQLVAGPGIGLAELGRVAEAVRHANPHVALAVDHGGGGLRKQLERADRAGAELALLVGPDEMAAGSVTVKPLRLDGAEQITVPLADVAAAARSFAADH
jgi:histidyl-tRNA synthetase